MTFDDIAKAHDEHIRRLHLRVFDSFFEEMAKIDCSDEMYAEVLRRFHLRLENEIRIVEQENDINATRKAMAIDDAQTSLPFVPEED